MQPGAQVADKIPEEQSSDSGRLAYERKADSQRNLEIRQFAIIRNNMRFNSGQLGLVIGNLVPRKCCRGPASFRIRAGSLQF